MWWKMGSPKLRRTPKEKASVSCQMMLADYMQSPHKVCIFHVLDKLEQGVTHRCKAKASNCDNNMAPKGEAFDT